MRGLTVVVSILLIVISMGCKQKGMQENASSKPLGGDIVAKVGGEAVTAEELAEAVKPDMQKIEMKVYQIEKRALDSLIDQKLVLQAAKKRGQNREEYIKSMINDRVQMPTDDEIKAVYDARRGNTEFEEPLEGMKDRIANYLVQTQQAKLEQDLISKLRSEVDVKIMLDVPRIDVPLRDAPMLGAKDAKVTFVEFSDYQCPFSGRVHDTVWQLIEKYKDNIKYVYRDFPLSFHRDAQKAHEAAHCAGDQDKYFEYNKILFANQKDLGLKDLKKYAVDLNLDPKEFNKCLDEGKYTPMVKESLEDGQAAGVSGTPAFFINGILISGAQPIESFTEVIDAELQR